MHHLQGDIARLGHLHSFALGLVGNFVGKDNERIRVADLVHKIALVAGDELRECHPAPPPPYSLFSRSIPPMRVTHLSSCLAVVYDAPCCFDVVVALCIIEIEFQSPKQNFDYFPIIHIFFCPSSAWLGVMPRTWRNAPPTICCPGSLRAPLDARFTTYCKRKPCSVPAFCSLPWCFALLARPRPKIASLQPSPWTFPIPATLCRVKGPFFVRTTTTTFYPGYQTRGRRHGSGSLRPPRWPPIRTAALYARCRRGLGFRRHGAFRSLCRYRLADADHMITMYTDMRRPVA